MNKIFPLFLFLALMISSCQNSSNEPVEPVETVADNQLQTILEELSAIYADDLSHKVIQPAEGYLKYPYLIPAGFYKQMWDWDGFFMGNYFVSKGKPEYLQYWALNLIEGIDEKGYVSGCATTKGPRPIFGDFSMKPFLSQGVLLASRAMDDFEWVRPCYEKMCRALSYRERTQQDSLTGLFFWQIAMQSGADNNVALNYFTDDPRSFLACDASTLQLREYEAQSIIAQELGFETDARVFKEKADSLRQRILDYLWCSEDQMFYNIDRETMVYYKRVSYSCFWPLVEGLLSQEEGGAMIERYLISADYMKSDYGFRTLSKTDPDYNNKNMITPFSNWQGPVWPIANYIYSIALHRYGYDEEVRTMAVSLGQRLIDDYQEYGSLHECYDAETGAALSPADTYVDSEGRFVGFVSWNLCIENVLRGICNNDWMDLEL